MPYLSYKKKLQTKGENIMKWIKKENGTTVSEIVANNTGIPENVLRFDEHKYTYTNLHDAAVLFLNFIKSGQKIAFHGDYDCDGVTSLCQDKIMASVLHITNCIIYPPKRFTDGFGVKTNHIDWYHKQGVKLLLLQDNGIAAVDAVAKAREYGMTVIILDHHMPVSDKITGEYILPDADIIVDPHVTGGDFDDLCGAGVTFRFWNAVMDKCPWLSDKYKWVLRKKLSCFAALGTIGDVVSLIGDNRLIVKEGIDAMTRGFGSVGLKALLEEMKVEYISAPGLAFGLCPIINASGRLYDDGPRFIMNLLSATEDSPELRERCKIAIERNKERKQKEQEAMERASHLMEGHENDRFIVLVDEQCTSGIAGLVSGKLTEQYNRPSIILAPKNDSNELVKGSGRSVESTDIFALISRVIAENPELVEAFGGHSGACGITLRRDKLEQFITAVNKIAPEPEVIDSIYYDIDCDITNIADLMKEINRYQPYGQHNPELIVRFNNVPVYRKNGSPVFVMGKNEEHIKLMNEYAPIVWFYGTELYRNINRPSSVDVLGKISLNVSKGNTTIQIQAVDVVPGGESHS